MADVRGVLFDFYGTLARAVVWGETHEAIFARRGLAGPGARWGSQWVGGAVDGEEHAEHSANRDAYVAWELDRLRTRARACGVGEDELEPLVADLHRASKTYTLAAYDEVAEVLAELRRRGLVLAVCSNWDWDLAEQVANVGLDAMVDDIISSAHAGARKPHPRIFTHTLDRCGLSPSETLFVGDTWGPDVEGPLAAGLRPVHLFRDDQAERARESGAEALTPPLPDGVVRATDLRAVLELVTLSRT
ncbi:MAG: putative hydrolase of the superfamily [Actinomycetota bacterium]|nr:putative hydrolase of the superfamily [Actinomycetota bacterium]